MMRYVIVGTGVAAIAAAEAIRETDATGEILIFGDDPHGYYSRPGLAYYLTGELPETLLPAYPASSYAGLRARHVRQRVRRIRVDERVIETDDGGRWSYDRLLLATGAAAISLSVPGASLRSVFKLDHLEDARQIVRQARRSRAAVVVGGGITALELVEGLRARGVKVHYLLRGDRYWGNVLDETESGIVQRRLRGEGVILHFNAEVAEVLEKPGFFGRTGKVGGVRTVDGETIKCDLLAYAVGVAPRISLARQAGIECDKGIVTDEYLQTSVPGIYAAGDAAQVFDPASGEAPMNSLWGPAREQGRLAGLNMAGQRTAYVRRTPFNVTRLAGLTTTIIGAVGAGRDTDVLGIVRGDSAAWRQVPDAGIAQGGFEVNRLRLMVGKTTLVGAIIMGDQELSLPLETMIRENVDISAIREKLLAPGAKIAEILASFWGAWRPRHAA